MIFSPFSVLYQSIAAQMTALGMMHADESAFKTWCYAAWVDSGFTQSFAVLKQPAAQLSIQFNVRVAASERKVNIWWGDGTSNSYSPNSSSDTSCAKNYASGASYPVVMIGLVSRFTSSNGDGKTAFGGILSRLVGLTYCDIRGSNTVSGTLPVGLTYCIIPGNNTVSGTLPVGLTFCIIEGSNTVSGTLPIGLTYCDIFGNNTVSASDWATVAKAATGLCHLSQGGLTVLSSTDVNAILAGFWANRNAAKSRGERSIGLNKSGNGAPTGQGVTDKAALQAYRSPTPPGTADLWTVTTN